MSESAKPSIAERLRIFREAKKLSQSEMALALDGTTGGYQKNEQGVTFPNSKMLIGLYGLGLNINWLLSGEGAMLLSELQAAENEASVDLDAYGECLEILEIALNKFNRVLTPEKKRKAVDSIYRAWKREKKIDSQLVDMITQLAA